MKITLFCNAGMSTSLVGSKLKKSYEAEGMDYEIGAFDFSNLETESKDSDVIILGPQIAWAFDDVYKQYPEKKVILLTMQEFGSMNGDIIRKRIEKELAK